MSSRYCGGPGGWGLGCGGAGTGDREWERAGGMCGGAQPPWARHSQARCRAQSVLHPTRVALDAPWRTQRAHHLPRALRGHCIPPETSSMHTPGSPAGRTWWACAARGHAAACTAGAAGQGGGDAPGGCERRRGCAWPEGMVAVNGGCSNQGKVCSPRAMRGAPSPQLSGATQTGLRRA